MKEFLKPILGEIDLKVGLAEIVDKLGSIKTDAISHKNLFYLQAEKIAFGFSEQNPFYY